MEITRDILREFQRITSKNIEQFFANALIFLQGDYNTITAYYSGRIKEIDSRPFKAFDDIKMQRDIMFAAFTDHKRRLNNMKWWLVLEQLEQIDSRLNTLAVVNKWSRSSATKVAYDPSIEVSYTLKENQTLERVSQDILKDPNPNDDWVDIAVSNDLTEEEYSPDGGTELKLKFPKINRGIRINAVVDVMIGKSIYGKDLDKTLQFDPTTQDLKVLDYDNTALQSAQILAGLKKNDNPDSPNSGLQSAAVVGSNRALLNYPVIIRQLTSTFATDDSFKNFQVTLLDLNQDNLQISYEVQTRLNETVDGQVVV